MKISVFGTGYVGLVAGTCFAESGNNVLCVDIDQKKIAKLRNGEIPIYEPGLSEIVKANAESGRLVFSTSVEEGVTHGDVIFIAVGTPQDHDGSADLQYVLSVAKSIGQHMKSPKVVVNKSTVPVGTAALVREAIAAETEIDFDVVSNPEFLKEGSAVDDFMKPDRVVIGADSEKAAKIMCDLYSPFVRTGKPIVVMSVPSAEITKYASNALLATKVTFMNEIANFCELVGGNVSEVRKGVGLDSRIGPSFLFPGVGYGGSCFPKDVRALIKKSSEFDYEMEIIKAVDAVNQRQKHRLVQKIVNHFGGESEISGKRFALWGLAFKPKTDDMREAPSLTVISDLAKLGASVSAYDPEALESAREILDKSGDAVKLCASAYEALSGADALIIVTEWNEFRKPDFQRVASELNNKVIFDGRNLYDPKNIEEQGFVYHSIGRPTVGA